jgi:hypothetical protein
MTAVSTIRPDLSPPCALAPPTDAPSWPCDEVSVGEPENAPAAWLTPALSGFA